MKIHFYQSLFRIKHLMCIPSKQVIYMFQLKTALQQHCFSLGYNNDASNTVFPQSYHINIINSLCFLSKYLIKLCKS